MQCGQHKLCAYGNNTVMAFGVPNDRREKQARETPDTDTADLLPHLNELFGGVDGIYIDANKETEAFSQAEQISGGRDQEA